MPQVLELCDECLGALAQHRTAERARRLALCQLACVGRHTVTGLLYTGGRQFVDWSGDYRLFSRDRWKTQELFVPLTRGLLDLLPDGAPFAAAMDDTLLRKSGRKIPGVAYRRDPLSPPFHVNFVRGQRFLQLSGLLPPADGDGPARGLPISFEHVPPVPKPGQNASAEERQLYRQRQKTENLNTRAVEVLQGVRRELDERQGAAARHFLVSVDGGYTNKTVLKNLPERTTLIGRIRQDAELFHPPRPEDQASVGPQRQYGRAAPTPEELRQEESVSWQEVSAFAAGKRHTFRVKTLAPVLWKKAGATQPLRLVVIAPIGYRLRKNSKILYRQPAFLICTDPNLPLEQLLQHYVWRWEIEVNHRDEKQIIGVGEAQVRAAQSVDRQPAFAVACYSILLLAAAREARTNPASAALAPPKWQTQLPRLRRSTQELIRQLRSEVWNDALNRLGSESAHFVTTSPPVTKWAQLDLPAASALLYAATG